MINRILIVEDHEDILFLLRTVLEDSECEIRCAASVAEATSLIGAEVFDLVILDVRLPDGDGIELCRRLRARWPHLVIVFYTAAAYQRDRQRAEAAGCDAYFVKPNDLPELERFIKEKLEMCGEVWFAKGE